MITYSRPHPGMTGEYAQTTYRNISHTTPRGANSDQGARAGATGRVCSDPGKQVECTQTQNFTVNVTKVIVIFIIGH